VDRGTQWVVETLQQAQLQKHDLKSRGRGEAKKGKETTTRKMFHSIVSSVQAELKKKAKNAVVEGVFMPPTQKIKKYVSL
jgi:hypothetical protein